MKSFGQQIKELREKEQWTQRRLANALDVDVAVLSRIENENRFPKKRVGDIIRVVSNLFDTPESYLKLTYLSDEIASILETEEDYQEILKVTEAKVHYGREKKSVQSKLNFENESD
ncbi:hypothetical protein BFP97_14860 [Roseivirga sp. 4D4]|uniref:helix-turn-helix domain-containing protein n=1 Tax=Roseivirga sp. 4D4 TaxID=1889784 RepID=UPI000853D474|nr:helix-turn-helix transcriptional regulator [Roseivirga sp. 4D4]OEK02726.1 hypothetical protein BFP97_14860 [Roseivirga sp. 4D4]